MSKNFSLDKASKQRGFGEPAMTQDVKDWSGWRAFWRVGLIALALTNGACTYAVAPDKASPRSTAADARPDAGLDGQTVYQVLLAEIGLRRGSAELAVQAYADAAKRTGDPALLTRGIQIAGQASRHDVALELAQRWVQVSPESSHARQTLVGMLGAFGRVDEMVVQWRQLLQRDPAQAGTHLLQLNRLVGWMQDRTAALKIIERIVVDYDQHAEAHYALGLAALAAGERDKALSAARQAQTLRPEWPQAVLLEAQALGREGAPQAIERLGTFLKQFPEADDIALQRGRLLAGERRWPEARQAFDALLERRPDSNEVLYPLAIIALQQRDIDAAERAFKTMLDNRFPDRAMVLYHLGLIAEERKDNVAALAAFEQVRSGEYAFQARLRTVQVLARMGRHEEAQNALASIEPQDAAQRVRLAVAEAQFLRERNDFQGAFDRLAKALIGQPDEPDLLYDQAMIAERLNRIDIVESNLGKVIELRPENAHAYNALGYALADRNQRLDEAQGLIRKALQLAPDDPFILDSMGWVLFRLGRADEALTHLERAYKLRPDAEIAAHIGEVLWSLNRREDARKIWAEARKSNPDNEVLLGVIEKFQP
jgi:tetratricopeptide (TPR) repeat protein